LRVRGLVARGRWANEPTTFGGWELLYDSRDAAMLAVAALVSAFESVDLDAFTTLDI
jgi:hypothetical protein